MQSNFQSALITIFNKINPNFILSNGHSAYHIHNQTSINMPDESELHTCILQSSMHPFDEATDEDYNTDNGYYAALIAEIPTAFPSFNKIDDKGYADQFITPANDYIRIQPSDHCIIITIIASGQY